ncbi:MAG: sensor histidine kinase [Acidimicrobiales bacterium]
MRRRLMTAFIGLVAAVLVIAGAGSIVLTNNAARTQATQQLASEAQSLSAGTSHTQRLVVLKAVKGVLRLEDARVIRVRINGAVVPALPAGLTAADLDPQSLLAGDSVSGRVGDLAFAAVPVALSPAERTRLKLAGQIAILLTREVGGVGPSWVYFLISGAAALLIAALIAWQLSRRMSRPMVEAMEATARIASGDLRSRVPQHDNDYAESISLARSINEMAQSLEDGRSRERHLLLSVSHDLRTPLTSIRGFAEAISDGAIEDTAQAAEVIVAESRRLERLVGDLLELTKLESGQMSITFRPTDIAEVVSITAEGFRPLAESNELQLVVRVPAAGGATVMIDPDRLAQILANLVENALTFARTAVTVSLSSTGPEGTGLQVVTVEDDGPGITAGDLTRVFERFYQADHGPNRHFGSGIGLAIVAELASAMGASVRAESPIHAGSGSRFEVTLGRTDNGHQVQGALSSRGIEDRHGMTAV